MSLKDRLRRLTGEEESPLKSDPSDHREQLSELRRRLDAILSRRPGPSSSNHNFSRPQKNMPALQDLLSGCEESNSSGSFFRIDALREGTDSHGNRQFNELAALDMESVALLANDSQLSEFDGKAALFLDTETTGLSGGTGTLAFLIGAGWFDDEGRFIVRQLFARNFAEEQAVLTALTDIAASKRYLVTFNGKAFDVNLLASRYILNRLDNPLTALPHLDLLHPARRLFGHRVINSRLVTLEENLLGFFREDDLPGSEVPLRYFNWLRSRNPYPMLDVFRHNCLDITALAALTVHLAEIFNADSGSPHYVSTDFCAAARLYQDRGRQAEACSLLENLTRSAPQSATKEARQSLSLIYKRANQWDKAVNLWEDLLKENPENIFAAEELAKWHEHRRKDFESAFRLVDDILKTVPKFSEQEKEAWLHRHSRLQGRCNKEHPRRGHG
ncbi:hypothetical protein SAMN04489760_1088 [Syntrophus gentianae]|uniref:YprB ribonuclease H-like domain-containing protein n=1 Tax=Syntrophus gentianae TaxID=43775 RepID=A0A1H7WV26_9BACT|nr:ribonuclease H-like domain-containing protein [Syntrophus gentianae]SEM25135.1 hypothetical protein SAMN04489760_1088 [Syntrophus gentianae]